MKISFRYLQNYMIKIPDNGGSESVVDFVTNKFLISDTTLSSFIPPRVCKMNHRLRHICLYKLCIITKDMQSDLNIFRKIIV